jgi:hypothetical protein
MKPGSPLPLGCALRFIYTSFPCSTSTSPSFLFNIRRNRNVFSYYTQATLSAHAYPAAGNVKSKEVLVPGPQHHQDMTLTDHLATPCSDTQSASQITACCTHTVEGHRFDQRLAGLNLSRPRCNACNAYCVCFTSSTGPAKSESGFELSFLGVGGVKNLAVAFLHFQ